MSYNYESQEEYEYYECGAITQVHKAEKRLSSNIKRSYLAGLCSYIIEFENSSKIKLVDCGGDITVYDINLAGLDDRERKICLKKVLQWICNRN